MSKSGSRGFYSPSPHNTPHAGPHGAFPFGFQAIPRTILCSERVSVLQRKILIEIAPRLGSLPPPKINTPPIGFIMNFEIVESCPCPTGFSPSPCPIHYDRHLATMASADFWSFTMSVSRYNAVCLPRGSQRLSPRPSILLPVDQISPDKDIYFHHTTASFTLSTLFTGLSYVWLTHPRTRPYMIFLFVGS